MSGVQTVRGASALARAAGRRGTVTVERRGTSGRRGTVGRRGTAGRRGRIRERRWALAASAAVSVLALSACGGTSADAPGDAQPTTLTVFAAASLTDTFEQVADRFSASHAGAEVRLSFAGSSDLVTQVRQGAPADVIATADERTMRSLVDDGLLSAEPQAFVSNTLVIAVPAGNPAGVEGLADLAGAKSPADPGSSRDSRGAGESGLDVVVCAPQVPCGAATQTVAESAGVTIDAVSEEPAVTDVLGKVANGQADAGLVYRTDASGSDAVEAVEFPKSDDAVNRYPIAPVADAQSAELAEEFIDFVLSEEGRAVFDAAGFGAP